MLEVINLALPFFGLIFLGLGCGKFKAIPDSGLAWMDFFILYVALPALFYRIVAQTPLEQLANPRFIVGTMLATFCAFAVSFALGMGIRRGQMANGIHYPALLFLAHKIADRLAQKFRAGTVRLAPALATLTP